MKTSQNTVFAAMMALHLASKAMGSITPSYNPLEYEVGKGEPDYPNPTLIEILDPTSVPDVGTHQAGEVAASSDEGNYIAARAESQEGESSFAQENISNFPLDSAAVRMTLNTMDSAQKKTFIGLFLAFWVALLR